MQGEVVAPGKMVAIECAVSMATHPRGEAAHCVVVEDVYYDFLQFFRREKRTIIIVGKYQSPIIAFRTGIAQRDIEVQVVIFVSDLFRGANSIRIGSIQASAELDGMIAVLNQHHIGG